MVLAVPKVIGSGTLALKDSIHHYNVLSWVYDAYYLAFDMSIIEVL